jgi:hypothetical protein
LNEWILWIYCASVWACLHILTLSTSQQWKYVAYRERGPADMLLLVPMRETMDWSAANITTLCDHVHTCSYRQFYWIKYISCPGIVQKVLMGLVHMMRDAT